MNPPDTGAAFELAVGRTFRPVRLELTVSRQMIDLEQAFTGATYLDGSPIVPVADSGYTSSSTASVDYRLSGRLLLGLKLPYSLMDDMDGRDAYTYHGVPDLTNFTRISGIDYWSFLLNLKYLLRNGPDRTR